MTEQIISILLPLFALVFVGFLVGHFLKPDFRPINRINMDTFTPALVFSSLVSMPLGKSELPLLAAATIAVLIPAVIMWPLCKAFKIDFKAWTPPNMFRNSGNLAIPLFTYTFGQSASSAAVLLFVVSACLHISIGLMVLSSGNPIKQIVRMPVFIAASLALGLNIFEVTVWAPIYEATKLLGQAAIPVMLLSLGAQMCNLRLSGLKVGVISTILSLVSGGIAFAVIYLLIPLPTLHLQMMVLFSMLPPAVMNYLFAERFNTQPTLVASMVLFGNFFSVLTLPLLLSFALSLGQ
ncbi:AEC family transporter [Vibrio sp. TRT 21S02]|uniref:AEC family transporter n=1 Tax=Vibrio sp. TRT 21S02 TaxID=3418507 RepID=UPI003CF32040